MGRDERHRAETQREAESKETDPRPTGDRQFLGQEIPKEMETPDTKENEDLGRRDRSRAPGGQ